MPLEEFVLKNEHCCHLKDSLSNNDDFVREFNGLLVNTITNRSMEELIEDFDNESDFEVALPKLTNLINAPPSLLITSTSSLPQKKKVESKVEDIPIVKKRKTESLYTERNLENQEESDVDFNKRMMAEGKILEGISDVY